MNLLSDVITYVRRIIKSPSNSAVSDNLLIDYINRFWLMDVDARMQLFDFKTKYQFQTSPGVDQYNMPLYGTNGYPSQSQPGGQTISYYPVYQGFMGPAYGAGFPLSFYTERGAFFNAWPNYVQPLNNIGTGDGGSTYTLSLSYFPILRGHVDITGVIATGNNADPILGSTYNSSVPLTSIYPAVYITTVGSDGQALVANDSGQFLNTNTNLGLLTGDVTSSWSATNNTVNYSTGEINVEFSDVVPSGNAINAQCYFISPGMPRMVLFYNNVITIRPVPDISYLIELDAYLTPAAFLSTAQSIQFAYMSEYIARGAARKYLSDVGDMEQFTFYEPLFREQENLVWKRSQRQVTSTRTPTIYSAGYSGYMNSNFGTNNY